MPQQNTDTREQAQGELFYIRCTVEDAGWSALWWCPNGCGYTDKLSEAGKYTAAEVDRRTTRDMRVAVSVADSLSVRVVPARALNMLLAVEVPDGKAGPS